MSIFKCKMCGGTVEFESGATVGICDSCGTKQTLPRLDDDRRANLYDRANHFRRNNEFDKAAGLYEQILNEDTTDSEAYWSLVLCKYGIEYVEDPATHKRVPTVNRAQYTSVFDDDNYKSALQYADSYQRSLYEEEASAINEIQKGILAISQREEPFDVFICYKETDASGRRTPDSVLANDLYHQLTQEGFKVFFSRITLEDKLGTAYEPYIFAALNSAKAMVVIGTKPEYFNAVWVKNEWSRYLSIVKASNGKKILIPAYRDMDPYDLPEEFSHLQAQDMSKLGFMQDLIRGIKKIVKPEDMKPRSEGVARAGSNTNASSLLRRAFIFLEDGDFAAAEEYCEKVLDLEPENAEAYLGKLMAEQRVSHRKNLRDCKEPFDTSDNYQKALRFSDESLGFELKECIAHINERNENARLTGIYDKAVQAMNGADNEDSFKSAAAIFNTISSFKDAEYLAERCEECAEQCRKDSVYNSAKEKMVGDKIANYESAMELFRTIPEWRDADEQVYKCQEKIETIKIEKARKAEQDKIKAGVRAKKAKKIAIVLIAVVILAIIGSVVNKNIIVPANKYKSAIALLEDGKYDEAIAIFNELGDYKDSKDQINAAKEAKNDSIYNNAQQLYRSGKYSDAIAEYEKISSYKDSSEQIKLCKYEQASKLIESEDYDGAINLLDGLNYKDSDTKLSLCKYENAKKQINANEYIVAYELLDGLNYKDSQDLLEEIRPKYQKMKKLEPFITASIGSTVGLGSYKKEAINWVVLARDKNRVLLISEKTLDYTNFNDEKGNLTWEMCDLRQWCNNTFYQSAFSEEEQSFIVTTTVNADKNPTFKTNPGGKTSDKVFLLSISEAEKYFSDNSSRIARDTEYVHAKHVANAEDLRNNGINVDDPDYESSWWLRTPGDDSGSMVAFVETNGAIDEAGKAGNTNTSGVRPAIWISIEP